MKSREALRTIAELSAPQWGMVTAAQATSRGVSRVDLARLASTGELVRLAHGVYRDSGAPIDEFEDLRVAWLSTEPLQPAEQRIRKREAGVVVSGSSAAHLHGVGDLRAEKHEFTTAVRRQSQRSEIRYRQRALEPDDVMIVDGLPTTTLERTLADLVEERIDLSLVADLLRDATRKTRLNTNRLVALLSPLAARNGHRRGDGLALLQKLEAIAGLDLASLATQIASSRELGALVSAEFLQQISRDGSSSSAEIAAASARLALERTTHAESHDHG